MAYDESLASRVRALLSSRTGVEEKSLFGGLNFSINGNMVCSINSTGFTLSVGKDNYDRALAMSGLKAKMLGTKPMNGMVVAENAASISDSDLEAWVNMAADVAAAKPAKVKK